MPKKKISTNEVVVRALDNIKDLGVAFFDAAAVNPIMATAGGLLPYVLLSLVAPAAAMAGMAGVGAVAGLSNIPNVSVSTPIFDFGIAAAVAKWPAQINIIKKEKAAMTDEETINEAKMVLKHLLPAIAAT